MAIYRDTRVFCLSITGTENFQYHPLLHTYLSAFASVLRMHLLTSQPSVAYH